MRVIWGDGMVHDEIKNLINQVTAVGYSAENVSFGMGAGLLQKLDRMCKFAFKCSQVTVDGRDVDVYKEPITDKGKVSKRGRLDLVYDGVEGYRTVQAPTFGSALVDVYSTGKLLKTYSLREVRARPFDSCNG